MNLYHNLLALTFKAPTNVGNYPACLIHHCIESQLNSTETGLSATSSMSSIVPIDTDPISPHYFCSLLCLIYLRSQLQRSLDLYFKVLLFLNSLQGTLLISYLYYPTKMPHLTFIRITFHPPLLSSYQLIILTFWFRLFSSWGALIKACWNTCGLLPR